MLKKQMTSNFKNIFACFISLLSFLLWTVCPVYAANGDLVQEYTFTVEQMNALLSSSTLTWTASNSAGTQNYDGTLTYTVPNTSSLGVFFAYNNNFSGPASYNFSFTLTLPLDLTCISFNVTEFAGFKVYLPNPSGGSITAVPPAGIGFSTPAGFSDSSTSFGQYDFLFDSFTWKVLRQGATFSSTSGIDETVTSLGLITHVKLPGPQFGIVFGFSDPITYTATASEQEQILAKLDEIIQNQDDNTDKIIGFLETPDDSTSQKVNDFNTTIDNSDNKLDDLSDSLAVSVPDLESELDTSIIDNNFDSSIVSSLFSPIVNNEVIITLMLISLTFAVFGIIIHGKDS